MELLFVFSAFLLLCFMLLKQTKKKASLKLPPGPPTLPVIGNLHQLYGSLAHRKLRDLAKKYGPLMHLQLGEVLTIVVTSPEAAKEVYKTHDILFSQRPSYFEPFRVISYNFTDIVFSPYGSYWRELRKICNTELLSPMRVQTFRSIREEEVFNLIRSISLREGSIVNLTQEIFSLTYGITSRAAFGKRSKDQEKFESLMEETTRLFAGFSLADMYPSVRLIRVLSGMEHKLMVVHKQVDKILQDILNEHKEDTMKREIEGAEGKEDLIDVLLRIQKNGDFEAPLTDDNIKGVIFDIFSAGSETSSIIVEWAMSETLKNPRILKRALDEVRQVYCEKGTVDESRMDELKYIQAIAKETLRLHPSSPLLVPRECSEQCNIHGYDIPVKARIIVNAWALARDPEYWDEAEEFKPERFFDSDVDYKGNCFQYIPFGAGRRICPGVAFGLPNVILPLAQLLFHFDWKLPGEVKLEDLDMNEIMGAGAVRREKSLNLIPILHHRSCLKK